MSEIRPDAPQTEDSASAAGDIKTPDASAAATMPTMSQPGTREALFRDPRTDAGRGASNARLELTNLAEMIARTVKILDTSVLESGSAAQAGEDFFKTTKLRTTFSDPRTVADCMIKAAKDLKAELRKTRGAILQFAHGLNASMADRSAPSNADPSTNIRNRKIKSKGNKNSFAFNKTYQLHVHRERLEAHIKPVQEAMETCEASVQKAENNAARDLEQIKAAVDSYRGHSTSALSCAAKALDELLAILPQPGSKVPTETPRLPDSIRWS